LSKVDFLNWSNVQSTSYHNAFKELIDKCYLIPAEPKNKEPTSYDFFEIPKENTNKPIEQPREEQPKEETEEIKEINFNGFIF